jgi:hypothetical protein
MALDVTSRLRWAPTLSHVLWLLTLPPGQGGSQCYHTSHSPQWIVDLRYIKKGLAGLHMQLCSRVSKAHAHVPKMSDARVIMGLQDVWINDDIITCKTCGRDATVQLNSVMPRRSSHQLPTASYKALPAVIGRQPPQCHLSGLGSAYNCHILCYKGIGQSPISTKLFEAS